MRSSSFFHAGRTISAPNRFQLNSYKTSRKAEKQSKKAQTHTDKTNRGSVAGSRQQAGRPAQPEIVKGWQHLADEIRQQQQHQQQQTSSAAEQQQQEQQRDQDHRQQQEHQSWDKLNK